MISRVTIRSALINILQIIVFSYKLFFDNAKKSKYFGSEIWIFFHIFIFKESSSFQGD